MIERSEFMNSNYINELVEKIKMAYHLLFITPILIKNIMKKIYLNIEMI